MNVLDRLHKKVGEFGILNMFYYYLKRTFIRFLLADLRRFTVYFTVNGNEFKKFQT